MILFSGSDPYKALENIILSTTLVKDIGKLSGGAQTAALESYHSLLLLFAPKHTSFSYLGMVTRYVIIYLCLIVAYDK